MIQPTHTVIGNVAATGMSFEDYLVAFDSQFAEWIDGVVILMSPIHERHDAFCQFFTHLLGAYLALRPVGKLRTAPFVMKISADSPAREPDLQVILNENTARLTPTYTNGPADLVIEIVSEESSRRDRGDKFDEYEAGGVREYWLIDPLRAEAGFYALGEDGRFKRAQVDAGGQFRSTVLPGFRLDVALLWRDELPNALKAVQLAQQMIGESQSADR